MSRTYHNGPVYRYHYKGEFYKWKDIPEVERKYAIYKEVFNEEKTNKSRWGFPVFDYVPTGEYKTYLRKADSECVELFNQKSRHPDDKNYWGGVGKYNKQIRSRNERSKIKNLIQKKYIIEEDYNYGLPRERNHDRWDYW